MVRGLLSVYRTQKSNTKLFRTYWYNSPTADNFITYGVIGIRWTDDPWLDTILHGEALTNLSSLCVCKPMKGLLRGAGTSGECTR